MISEFKDEFKFLSNFYSSPIEFEGIIYPTVEHAYQASKTDSISMREKIASLPFPGQAKKYGRKVEIRKDWDKLEIMKELLRKKFSIPELKELLLSTNDEMLIEGNWWNDVFWGIDLKTKEGENHLDKLLMEIRDEL